MDPESRPRKPIVLAGGVIPSGKKSWMKGKTWRDTEVMARSMARVQQSGEGVAMAHALPDRKPLTQSAIKRGARVANTYDDWQPPVKGQQARKLSRP